MDIPHISVSRKQLFDLCQVKYRYKYHLKIPSPEPDPFYFHYGTIIHKISEEYCRANGKITLNEIASQILTGKMPLDEDFKGNKIYALNLPADYKKRFPDHLLALQKIINRVGTDGFFEWEFNYDLEPPKGKIIKGFIDRLIQREDKWFIIDYKTTQNNHKTEFNITRDLQLCCYARIIQKTFNVEAENITAALYYLEKGGKMIAAKFSETALENVEKELLETYNQIKEIIPENAKEYVGSHCNYCEYKTICPFYQISLQNK